MKKTRPVVHLINGDSGPIEASTHHILAECSKAAMDAGWTYEEWKEVRDNMLNGDYIHFLSVTIKAFQIG